jgi:curved DNA-binding protein CbpA
MPGPLVPDDDLYARLELPPDATPEAIELAWRALLKRHHPDVAGDGNQALEQAKRINIAHDWLSDAALRDRYDQARFGGRTHPEGWSGPAGYQRRGRGGNWRPSWPGRDAPGSPRPGSGPARTSDRPRAGSADVLRGDPATRMTRFLARVARLNRDELDRLSVSEAPPIAFLATIRRFLPADAITRFDNLEPSLVERLPPSRRGDIAVRDALLAVAAELELAPFLNEHLDEPFRSRARERLVRAWQAAVDQPRYGPNGEAVRALTQRIARITPAEANRLVRESRGIPADERPWPPSLDPDTDEALRVSAAVAARDAGAAVPVANLAPSTATRARRLAGRIGHIVALRHAWSEAPYRELLAPWHAAIDAPDASTNGSRPVDDTTPSRPAPRVRRSPGGTSARTR